MDLSPAFPSRAPRAAALALALCAACSDGGGDGFIDGLVAEGADPTGVYDAGYTILTSTGCGLEPDDTGAILVVVTPAADGAYRVHIRLDGATDIGPYVGTVSAVSLGEVQLSVTGVGALNEGTPNEILYDLGGTTLIAGGGPLSGTLAEVVSGAANCTVTRAISGSSGSGSSDLSGTWAFELATSEADSGCADATSEAPEELTGIFTGLGGDSYLLSLDDEAGDVDGLDVVANGDELLVSGSYDEQDGALEWTITVASSAVTIFDDFVTGSLTVNLSGGIECERVLGIFAMRTSTSVLVGDGFFEGAWLSAGGSRRQQVLLRLEALPLGAQGAFTAAGVGGDGPFLLAGRLRTPWEVVGRLTLCRDGGEGVAGGPVHLWRTER
ncbi:MAG: hypothetical protein CMJ84_11095 [Planctomycetes bacterium]|jgi:hypothetical protein|nr:hypothetical protein [Planctomycetota bacterium]MDP6409220.1 hypothetical protein [Planctomycetota bacterium]